MALNQNQFSQIPVQGQLDMKMNPNTVSCEVDSTSAGGLLPGQPVKLVDSAGGVPKVVECAADTDDVYGFISYNLKDQVYAALSKVEISLVNGGNVMYMTASAAISRGANVEIVIAGTKIAPAASGKRIVGQAFDKASANGDLIRVLLLPKAILAP